MMLGREEEFPYEKRVQSRQNPHEMCHVWAAAGLGMEKRNMATVVVSTAFLLLPAGNSQVSLEVMA